MNKKTGKIFLRTLMLSLLAVFVLGSVSVSAAAKKTGFVTQSGKTYYINKDGTKQKGWLELNGKKYYFDKKTGVQLKGWAKDSAGKLLRYFTSGSGYMVTGFLTDSKGHTRYFDPKTGLLTRGWMTDKKGYKYYFTSGSGVMAKGWLQNSKGEKRFFNTNTGKMRVGWVKNAKGESRFFHLTNGIMYTGLKKVDNAYYYFSESTGFRYQKGLLKVGTATYYFDKTTGKAQIGWLKLDGKKYYFGEKGVRYENTTATIDGKTYQFDKNGVAKVSDYVIEGNNIIVHDKKNNRDYKVWKTFLELPGLASGEIKDEDILAALCESEAGGQGHVGMVAVALCVLNRTIKPDREFPSELRYTVYQGGAFAQYSPVQNGQLHKRLRDGQYYDRAAAYKAAKAALQIFDDYVKTGKPRTLAGFDRKDFNFMYFMSESSFYNQNLNFSKVDNFLYKYDKYVPNSGDAYHMFFVDWV